MPSLNLVRLGCEDNHYSSAKIFKKYNLKKSKQQTKLFIHSYKQLGSKIFPPNNSGWWILLQNMAFHKTDCSLFAIFSVFPLPTDYCHDISITNLMYFNLFFTSSFLKLLLYFCKEAINFFLFLKVIKSPSQQNYRVPALNWTHALK